MQLIPSGNIGEVSSAEAAPEQLTLVTVKRLHRKILLLIKEKTNKLIQKGRGHGSVKPH